MNTILTGLCRRAWVALWIRVASTCRCRPLPSCHLKSKHNAKFIHMNRISYRPYAIHFNLNQLKSRDMVVLFLFIIIMDLASKMKYQALNIDLCNIVTLYYNLTFYFEPINNERFFGDIETYCYLGLFSVKCRRFLSKSPLSHLSYMSTITACKDSAFKYKRKFLNGVRTDFNLNILMNVHLNRCLQRRWLQDYARVVTESDDCVGSSLCSGASMWSSDCIWLAP